MLKYILDEDELSYYMPSFLLLVEVQVNFMWTLPQYKFNTLVAFVINV